MDLKGIAVSNANSPFADCDETCPTEDAVQEMTGFFQREGSFGRLRQKRFPRWSVSSILMALMKTKHWISAM